jgi:hypothetical protein
MQFLERPQEAVIFQHYSLVSAVCLGRLLGVPMIHAMVVLSLARLFELEWLKI